MSIEQANNLIKRFGDSIELIDLQLDDGGYCCLNFDEMQTHLQYDFEKERLILFSKVGVLGEDVKNHACASMLSANLFWSGTNGGTLCLQPEDNIVFLIDKKEIQSFDFQKFEKWMTDFVNAAEDWLKHIAEFNAGKHAPHEKYDAAANAYLKNVLFV